MNKSLDGGRRLSRRQFLGAVWGVSIAALVGQFGAAFYNFVKPRPIVGGFGGKVTAGKAKEFKAGTVAYVQSGRFYVSSLDDGSVLALWQRCTHLGCTVPYVKDKKQFQCPCHSSVYNTKGEVISGPAPRPLDLFPIEVVNGDLVVDTGHPITRDKFDPTQATRV